jgi:hypothetical protein
MSSESQLPTEDSEAMNKGLFRIWLSLEPDNESTFVDTSAVPRLNEEIVFENGRVYVVTRIYYQVRDSDKDAQKLGPCVEARFVKQLEG